MICLEDDPRRKIVLPSWEKYGIVVNQFEAITPATMNILPEKLIFGSKVRKWKEAIVPFSETEKAIWHSHIQLWKKCIEANKPFLILEEDVQLIKPLPNKWEIVRLLCIARAGKKTSPAAGYIILPRIAVKMYERVVYKSKITYNVDSVVKKYCDVGKLHNYPYAIQIEGESSIAHM